MSIPEIVNLYSLVADLTEQGEKPPLPSQYVVSGLTVTVPPSPPTGVNRMAAILPAPLATNTQVLKLTWLFEGNGAGWSESLHVGYPESTGDPYAAVIPFLTLWNQARRAALSDSNSIIAVRISLEGVSGDTLLLERPAASLGVGGKAGPPADVNNGLLYVFADASRQVKGSVNYSGWAQADMAMTESAARDREDNGPAQTAWATFLQSTLAGINGIRSPSLAGGIPCIQAKARGTDSAAKTLIESFGLDAQGRLILRTEGPPAGWTVGSQLQIMYKRNRFVVGLAGQYQIIKSQLGNVVWETTTTARPCGPIELYSYTAIYGRPVTFRYYPISSVRIGNFSRRSNGAQFFVHRGRRRRSC